MPALSFSGCTEPRWNCRGFREWGAKSEWDDARYREKIVYSYRLIYRVVSPERIEVLAVIHGTRLLPDVIRDRGR